MIKTLNHHIYHIQMQIICMDGQCLKNYRKMVLNGQKKKTSKFNEDFIKNMMKTVLQDIFLNQMYSIQKNYLILIDIYHFYLKEEKLEEKKNLYAAQKTKKMYPNHIRNLKQALCHGLKLKEVHKVTKFNQKNIY